MTEIITPEMEQIRSIIIQTVAKRSALKAEMEEWFSTYANQRFPKMSELITVDSSLSELDSHYKRLWDYYNARNSAS